MIDTHTRIITQHTRSRHNDSPAPLLCDAHLDILEIGGTEDNFRIGRNKPLHNLTLHEHKILDVRGVSGRFGPMGQFEEESEQKRGPVVVDNCHRHPTPPMGSSGTPALRPFRAGAGGPG